MYLFLHGLGQGSSSWDATMACFSGADKAVCPNLPELLNTHDPVTYQSLYKALCEYCENLGEPLNVCGLSLGGMLALNYAGDHPNDIESLVLIGARFDVPSALLRLQNAIYSIMPNRAFSGMGFDKQGIISLSKSMMKLDFSNCLSNIGCRTLVLCGDKDGANKKAALMLGKQISNATFKLIADSGHEVNVDAPQALSKALNDFYGF